MFKLLRNAPARCLRSLTYSLRALAAIFKDEESFRLEALGFFVLMAAVLLSTWPVWKVLVMAACYLFIPLMEVLNTAIEDLCDLITREQNPLVRKAKDLGALAVLLAIVVNALVLAALILI